MQADVILRVVVKVLIAPVLLFALYVQFHGDYSPGGGFQAGVMVAVAVVMYMLIFGYEAAVKIVPPAVVEVLTAIGVLIYGGTGVLSMLLGANFLDYDVLAHDPHHGQHYGILAVEFGVGVTVAAVIITIFFAFVGRGRG